MAEIKSAGNKQMKRKLKTLRLKRYRYHIDAFYGNKDCKFTMGFVLSCVPIDKVKALKIARVLYPGIKGLKVKIKKEFD